jgi:phosphoribosylamine--glycine ligase
MATSQGFKVLEYNARFGDPETQLHMLRLETDLLDVLDACVDGTLSKVDFRWHPGFAACVVMASGGYPGQYKKGYPISGLEEAEKVPGVAVFHAGTTFDGKQFLTAGGRVLGVSARGETLKEAIDRTYEAVALIHFEDMQYRRDIGAKCL